MQPNKEFKLIELSPDDWKRYKDIRLESLLSDPYAFGSNYEKEVEYTQEKWRSRLMPFSINSKQWYSFIETKEGRLVGTIGAYVPEDDNPIIVGVYVNKEYRGKGLATLLLKDIIQKIEAINKYSICMLSVNSDQINAVKLYKNAGFKIIGEGFGILGDGKEHPEYIMRLDLKN